MSANAAGVYTIHRGINDIIAYKCMQRLIIPVPRRQKFQLEEANYDDCSLMLKGANKMEIK